MFSWHKYRTRIGTIKQKRFANAILEYNSLCRQALQAQVGRSLGVTPVPGYDGTSGAVWFIAYSRFRPTIFLHIIPIFITYSPLVWAGIWNPFLGERQMYLSGQARMILSNTSVLDWTRTEPPNAGEDPGANHLRIISQNIL